MNNICKFLLLSLCILTFNGCGSTVHKNKTSNNTISTVVVIDSKSESMYKKASTLYQKGENDTALKVLNEALNYDSNNYKALSLKGLLLSFNNQSDDGIKLIEKSLQINTEYTQGFYEMAMALKLNGQYEKSIKYFEKVIEKDTKNTWSYYGISTNYADMGNKEQALFYLKKAIDLGGNEVKSAAFYQDHFEKFHGNSEFEKLIAN